MSQLRDLYQDVIIDHNASPRNFYAMEHPDSQAEGFNPLCGDQLQLFLRFEDGTVKEASFQGNGCAISIASASLMTEMIMGLNKQNAKDLFNKFHQLLTCESCDCDLGKLAVLEGVKEFPSRVKCATLAWHTLDAALEKKVNAVSTE